MPRPHFVLTTAQIEALASARMDTIDRQLMTGRIDQAEYETKIADLSSWIAEYTSYSASALIAA